MLWFRFKEGPVLSKFFGKLFFISFILLLVSLLWKYQSIKGETRLLLTTAHVFLIGLSGLLVNRMLKSRWGLLLTSLGILLPSLWSKNSLDSWAISQTNIPAVDQQAELIIKTKNIAKLKSSKLFKKYRLVAKSAFVSKPTPIHELHDYYVVDIPKGPEKNAKQIKTRLERSKWVEHIEWNESLRLEAPLSPPKKKKNDSKIWANDPDIDKQWYYRLLQFDKVHRLLTEHSVRATKKARLFVLDSGIDSKHEDLSGNYQSVGTGQDTDSNGHGTHCAGIAAAVSRNAKGIASLLPNNQFVSLSSVKVMNAYGIGTQQSIIKGILNAINQGADVISLSLGGVSSDKKQRAYQDAFDYGISKGVVFVVAAGNSSDDAARYTPANISGAITVAAIDDQEQLASFSNYLDNIAMPIAAPGTNIYSTMPNHKYAAMNGTSMATPFVASLVAIIKSIRPELQSADCYKILDTTAKKLPDSAKSGKLIQPYDALRKAMALQ